MNTQSTPVHIRLWHRNFWLMSLANLLLSMSMYLLIPTLPVWLIGSLHCNGLQVGGCMAVFALGLYVFGAFCNWLVQRFRRNRVCILAIILYAACVAALYYIRGLGNQYIEVRAIILLRLLMGAAFGLAQMILSSTLIIDTAESYKRTEANHSAAWFSRFSISLGPMIGLMLLWHLGFDMVLLASIFMSMIACVLILTVRFPFRTPQEDVHIVSTDRFLLPHSMPLFLNLLMVSLAIGLFMSLGLSDRFYGLIMGGFLLALLSQRYVFEDANLKSEIVTGLILLVAAVLLVFFHPLPVVWYVAPVFMGIGIGLIGSRFLLFFVKLSDHCQRGTSQSTYMLSWETGIGVGIGLGYALFLNDSRSVLITMFVLIVAAWAMYNYYTHNWFLQHKNR
ncbi:MAG: MFS transporter [Prevotella sp.]|nr:MFS transporter [Prevotella sp.]